MIDIELISSHRSDISEYLQKSVRNAFRDIGKKHPAEINEDLSTWNMSDQKTIYTYKLVKKIKY